MIFINDVANDKYELEDGNSHFSVSNFPSGRESRIIRVQVFVYHSWKHW